MKVTILVIDGFGIGYSADALEYGDIGANTYKSLDVNLKNLVCLGLNNIDGIAREGVTNPAASYGRLMELSKGKDTTTGHFELAGIVMDKPFPTYPSGFPKEIISEFESKIGRKTLFNGVASGTEIITRFGKKHSETGSPIVYTSADSVFQVAMNESVIPLSEQIEICKIARELLVGKNAVARVIMRPFIADIDGYTRTENRQDFSVLPPKDTLLDILKSRGYMTYAIGKIEDIFAHRGIVKSNHTHSNIAGLCATHKAMQEDFSGLIFTNLVDTDMLYGHRRDPLGYAKALSEIDEFLPKLIEVMKLEDILIITSDHGCDPKFSGTDHTREYVPILIYGKDKKAKKLGSISGFDFVSNYILSYLA